MQYCLTCGVSSLNKASTHEWAESVVAIVSKHRVSLAVLMHLLRKWLEIGAVLRLWSTASMGMSCSRFTSTGSAVWSSTVIGIGTAEYSWRIFLCAGTTVLIVSDESVFEYTIGRVSRSSSELRLSSSFCALAMSWRVIKESRRFSLEMRPVERWPRCADVARLSHCCSFRLKLCAAFCRPSRGKKRVSSCLCSAISASSCVRALCRVCVLSSMALSVAA